VVRVVSCGGGGGDGYGQLAEGNWRLWHVVVAMAVVAKVSDAGEKIPAIVHLCDSRFVL
jgi:hypothetical protein